MSTVGDFIYISLVLPQKLDSALLESLGFTFLSSLSVCNKCSLYFSFPQKNRTTLLTQRRRLGFLPLLQQGRRSPLSQVAIEVQGDGGELGSSYDVYSFSMYVGLCSCVRGCGNSTAMEQVPLPPLLAMTVFIFHPICMVWDEETSTYTSSMYNSTTFLLFNRRRKRKLKHQWCRKPHWRPENTYT